MDPKDAIRFYEDKDKNRKRRNYFLEQAEQERASTRADINQEFGQKINEMLRFAYRDYKAGYKDFAQYQELTQVQKEQLLKEDFYTVLKQVPSDTLLNQVFRRTVNNVDGFESADRIYFSLIISATYRRLGHVV